MDDLLHTRRRRRGKRRRRIYIGLAIVIAGCVTWYFWLRETPQERRQKRDAAVAAADAIVADTIKAARRPIEVKAAAKQKAAPDEALTAKWEEGKSVRLKGKLKKHQSVFKALENRGLEPARIQPVVSATSESFDFRKSRPGDTWTAQVNADGEITNFRYQTSPEDIWETVRNSNGSYSSTKIDVPVDKRETVLAGTVSTSLWEAFVDAGEAGKIIYDFTDIFAYSIDFNRETQPGDRFALIIEKVFLEGEFLRYGRIIAAEYISQGTPHRAFYYESNSGEIGYYDEDGKNLKRQFLKSPLASVRVTSRYGMRYHPTLGQQKMHHGVDYGAPIGTPIRSVADGRVTFAGRKGANGNLVVIRHANGYKTMYAHLHEVADGIHPGKRVTQKTIIGEVGNTGRSTGPHLHFGMKRHGQYVNPNKVEFARAEPLKGTEKKNYIEEVVDPLSDRLDAARPTVADSGNPLDDPESTVSAPN